MVMAAAVLRVDFRALGEGDTPTGTPRAGGNAFVGDGFIEIPRENAVREGNTGWWTFYPLGREARPNVWLWARRVIPGADPVWLWVDPDDPIVDRDMLMTIYQALRDAYPGRVWPLQQIRSAQAGDGARNQIRLNWPDERPRTTRQTGVDEDGLPILVDDGPDESLPRVGLYRGIGSARGERLR